MILSVRDSSKIKYGAGSIACGILAAGGSTAARYGLIGNSMAASTLPIAVIVVGVALISFGFLMIYQVSEKQKLLASLGKVVQISTKNSIEGSKSQSSLMPILQTGIIGLAAAVGLYVFRKWVAKDFSSSEPMGSNAKETSLGFPKSQTGFWKTLRSHVGAASSEEISPISFFLHMISAEEKRSESVLSLEALGNPFLSISADPLFSDLPLQNEIGSVQRKLLGFLQLLESAEDERKMPPRTPVQGNCKKNLTIFLEK